MSEKLNVLSLCTGNSCRSQMTEACSAGIETHGANQNAAKVMTASISSKT